MSIEPDGEQLRKAVEWVSEQVKENSEQNLSKIADSASFKFDLSPKDSEFLYRLCKKIKNKEAWQSGKKKIIKISNLPDCIKILAYLFYISWFYRVVLTFG